MIILDSDHMSVLRYAVDRKYGALAGRMLTSQDQEFATTAITLEESLRGWLAQVKRSKTAIQEVTAYARLVKATRFLSGWQIMPYSKQAADIFDDLRKQKIRIGTMDLKIAAIALAENAMLLSANLSDFQQVPGLLVEDWLT